MITVYKVTGHTTSQRLFASVSSKMDFLERCLHRASGEAGCKEEVSALVHTLLQTAKDLLGDVYHTPCKYDCSAARGLHVTSGYASLPACLLLLVCNLKWALS